MKFASAPNMDGWLSCSCPFHMDHSPSAAYNVYSGFFICWGCETRLKYDELCKRLGTKPPREKSHIVITKSGAKLDWRNYYEHAYQDYHSYLLKRRITEKEQELYGIRFTGEGVVIPLMSSLKAPYPHITGIVVRRFSSEGGRYRYYFDKNKPVFYPSVLNVSEPCIFVEGVFGALNLRKAYTNVYATLGASISERQKGIVRCLEARAFVAFDDDLPGVTNAIGLSQLNSNVKVILPGVEADEMDPHTLPQYTKHAVSFGEAYQYWQSNLMDY